MPFADLNTGARLYYDASGSGDPVIFIHGLMDVPRVHHAPLLDWLAGTFHVIAPSLRGYGQSTPKPRDFPPDFYHRDAADVVALVEALDLPPAHLIGYSDGGEVALIAAGLAPARFRSVAVWGAVGYFGPDMYDVAARAYPGDWIPESDRALHGITDIDPIMRQWVDSVQTMVQGGGDVSLSLAPNITGPLLIALGEGDTLNPAAYGQQFVDRATQAEGRVVVVPDCGHAIHKQRWDELRQLLGDFLGMPA